MSNTLELKKGKGTDYVIVWKSKDFESKLLSLHATFIPNKKNFEYKTGIQLNNTSLVKGQNNYAT